MDFEPVHAAQIAILAMCLAALALLAGRCLRHKAACWRHTLPAFVWFLHCAVYYAVVTHYHVAGYSLVGFSLQSWSVILRVHSVLTIFAFAWYHDDL